MLLQTTPCSTLWGVGELVLSSETDYANPFRDVAVTGVFRAPSGREVRALGFHDGDRIWRVRLMPDEVGTWTFTTSSTDGELGGATGSIEVGPARAGAHGPVRVSGMHHFAHADGTPYFLLGRTLYSGLVYGATTTASWASSTTAGRGSPTSTCRTSCCSAPRPAPGTWGSYRSTRAPAAPTSRGSWGTPCRAWRSFGS